MYCVWVPAFYLWQSLWWFWLTGWGHSECVSPSWKPSFSLHQAPLSYFLEAKDMFDPLRLQLLCVAPTLRLWRLKSDGHRPVNPKRDGRCGHRCAGVWGQALTGMCCILPGNAKPLHQFFPENCCHPSSCWQCSLWKRGLEAVGKIQLLSQMFQAQHKRAPGFPARREEKVYLTLLFFSKQHVARPLPASSHRERKSDCKLYAHSPPICNAGKMTSEARSNWFS